jgi:pyrroline-5-carboxylate reductase
MYREPAVAAAKLRENVTSPGGTTAAALAILRAPDGYPALLAKAAEAARDRAQELAG